MDFVPVYVGGSYASSAYPAVGVVHVMLDGLPLSIDGCEDMEHPNARVSVYSTDRR